MIGVDSCGNEKLYRYGPDAFRWCVVEIVDDALKEKEEIDVWNPEIEPVVSPTPVPEGTGVSEGDGGTGQGASGESGDMPPEVGKVAGDEGSNVSGEPEMPSGTPTPTPEPTPSTGWIEYDDDWWDAQMGESTGGYDDFYE